MMARRALVAGLRVVRSNSGKIFFFCPFSLSLLLLLMLSKALKMVSSRKFTPENYRGSIRSVPAQIRLPFVPPLLPLFFLQQTNPFSSSLSFFQAKDNNKKIIFLSKTRHNLIHIFLTVSQPYQSESRIWIHIVSCRHGYDGANHVSEYHSFSVPSFSQV